VCLKLSSAELLPIPSSIPDTYLSANMSRNFMNQDFGSEEEDDDDFNPVPAKESDDEGEQVKVREAQMAKEDIVLGYG